MSQLHIHSYGHGFPVVWFHGWGFDSHIWLDLIPDLLALPTQYQIFLVDLPGFGNSAEMDWDAFKSALLPHLPAQFSVLGWSLGGLFATRLACEEPQRIKHMLQVTSSPYFLHSQDWAGIAPEMLQDFYQRFTADPIMTRQQFIQSQVLSNNISELTKNHPISLPGLATGLSILKQWDLRSELAKLTMPVAYLFGRLDRIVPHQVYKTMQTCYPQFHYTLLAKSGHMPFLSHREAFLQWFEDRVC